MDLLENKNRSDRSGRKENGYTSFEDIVNADMQSQLVIGECSGRTVRQRGIGESGSLEQCGR